MSKIKVYLDYQCFPIWVYDDNGILIDNVLPKELEEDKNVEDSLIEIQNIYDGFFIDNAIEFKFIGFRSEPDRLNFLTKIDDAINLLKIKVGDLYSIENKINI